MSEASFLGKEWLVKANSNSSTPYLFKFTSSTIDLTCRVLFTDTKSVWTEELTSQQFARRWRQCNPQTPPQFPSMEVEDKWRASILELLGKAHTLGGMNSLSFDVVNTNYSDIAFSLESTTFRWRWETNYVGHSSSADIISKQLVLPLISTNHLLFTSAESIQDITDADVETAVDKIGRTARRSVDTHIKNALSKPRVATILGRISAMLNSLNEIPGIVSFAEELSLEVPSTPSRPPHDDYLAVSPSSNNLFLRDVEMSAPMHISPPAQSLKAPASPTKAGSATESSGDETKPTHSHLELPKAPPERASTSPKAESSRAAPAHATTLGETKGGSSGDDDSSPIRPPPKRTKRVEASLSDSDNEAQRRAQLTQLKGKASGSAAGAPKKGVRQPIKRGGKRF